MYKRIISAVLVCVLAFSAAMCCSAAADSKIVYGDVDGNGELEAIDVTVLQRHLAEFIVLDEEAQIRATVSGSDELTVIDATLIQRYLAEFIDSFPVERDEITIEFTDNKSWTPVSAYFYNYTTGEAMEEWPGIQLTDPETNADGKPVYRTTVDLSKYDRVIFNSGKKQTTATPVTKASYGYNILTRSGTQYIAGIYPPKNSGKGTLLVKPLDYPSGYNKNIYIWLPEGYDASETEKKYSTLYMSDGHNLFEKDYSYANTEWQCDESVLSLMNNGGDGVIVVGIDNSNAERVTELTPDIGPVNPDMLENITEEIPPFEGDVFADFVVNTVIPYIEGKYNVNSVRGFAGSSCGGQEAFYIGMEYPDTFSYIGALSSAVSYFAEDTWDEYLDTKDFSGDVPHMYLYTGTNEKDSTEVWIRINAVLMEGWLLDHGYPADKLYNVVDPDGIHHERYWALIFPEMLSWGLDV